MLGLVGLGVARGWWARLWPEETRDGYAGAGGFWAARVVRWGIFALLFMPAVALAAAPMALLGRGQSSGLAIVRRLVTHRSPRFWPFQRARLGA